MNYKDVYQLITSRQSLYTAQMEKGAKIPDEDIWRLLENANYAPSHKRTEPWRFIVFTGDKLLEFFEEMGRIYKATTPTENFDEKKIEKYRNKAQTLSHLIAICMKRDPDKKIPKQEEEYSVACSVQNMLLSMKSLNIIGYWGTGAIAFSKEMHQYLELGEDDLCMGFLQLGIPKKDLPSIPKKQMSGIETKVLWK